MSDEGLAHFLSMYKLIIAYDGTDFAGWQRQSEGGSIEQVVSSSFMRVFDAEVALSAASRTDAGVHALGQVVLCRTPIALKPEALRRAWNGALPQSVLIRSCALVSDEFHPRCNVQSKTYHYHFFTKQPLPFLARYGWYCERPVDLSKLEQVLAGFVGTHDFCAFCKARDVCGSTVRMINSITIEYFRRFSVYRISVTGPGFMRHMVRRLVGAAMFVATRSDMPIDYAQQVLLSGDPNNTLGKAPAHGLLLYKIRYGGAHEREDR